MRARYAVAIATLALGAGTVFASVAADAAPAHRAQTAQIVVRPVNTSGHAVSGFTVKSEPTGSLDCSDAGASPGAVSKNILECSPSAEYAIACWKSATAHQALCMRNPAKDELAKIPYSGAFAHASAPTTNGAPLKLVLDNGAKCSIRDGGAWGTLKKHPQWNGEYSCTKGGDVWAKPSSTHMGVNESGSLWSVHTASAAGTGKVTVHDVTKAYFVGTKS